MQASQDFDLELIAAFIDGRLSGAERDRVIKLLAESEAAFEVYADAVRARDDLAQGSVSLEEFRERRRPWWWTIVPAAVAAVLLVAIFPKLQARRGVDGLDMPTQAMLKPLARQGDLASALVHQLDEPSWSVTRGRPGVTADSTTALRLGVRAADLSVAIGLRDRDHAARVATEIIGLVRPLSLSEASVADYENIRTRLANGEPMEQVGAAAITAEKNLADLLGSRWFGFGKWFGAGELAAIAHASSFFSDRETTRFLESAIERGKLASGDIDLLRQVSAVAAGGVTDNEFAVLRDKFAELIRRHGG